MSEERKPYGDDLVSQIVAAVKTSMKSEFDSLNQRFDKIEQDMQYIKQAIDELKDEVKDTTTTTNHLASDMYKMKIKTK
ncbi:hypothetical protein IC619_015505 [Hazenella sp. IB182353]|uniref:hypothetical protein n=1 Tax=Polycladospora coralii TaxID=2771432 RepID=UPI001746B5AB|nr:hypothetical protein [Polycladospora coralii]MBS7531879.1 hypothetical protein [Polycladospora coralii]